MAGKTKTDKKMDSSWSKEFTEEELDKLIQAGLARMDEGQKNTRQLIAGLLAFLEEKGLIDNAELQAYLLRTQSEREHDLKERDIATIREQLLDMTPEQRAQTRFFSMFMLS